MAKEKEKFLNRFGFINYLTKKGFEKKYTSNEDLTVYQREFTPGIYINVTIHEYLFDIEAQIIPSNLFEGIPFKHSEAQLDKTSVDALNGKFNTERFLEFYNMYKKVLKRAVRPLNNLEAKIKD